MHSYRKTILIFTIFCLMGSVAAVAELKIGYIRSDYIFANYQPYTEAMKQMDDFQKTELDKLQTQYNDLQAKAKEAQSQEILMTDAMKQKKFEELQKQQQEIELKHEELYKDDGVFSKKQTELLQPIIDQVNEVLMRIADEDEYDYIFDATPGGTVLFAAEKYEISDMLLEELGKDITSK